MKNKNVKIISIVLVAVLLITAAGIGIWRVSKNKKPDSPIIENGAYENVSLNGFDFNFDREHGAFLISKGGSIILSNAFSEYKLDDKIITSADYDDYELSAKGDCVTVTMKKSGLPDFVQIFTFAKGKDYFLLKTELSSDNDEISTNYIAPLVVKNGIDNSDGRLSRFLEVPYDNDAWIKFTTKTLDQSGTAYEVGALFTPDDGAGLIIGSVEHDLWRTAVTMNSKSGNINELKAYCGAEIPRLKKEAHGAVSGKAVSSATIMVGSYDNWKNGMNEFCDVNLSYQPRRRAVTDKVPIGWNSWGSVQRDLNYDIAIKTSDYVKENFQDIWQAGGNPVYINLDSYWDNLNDDELRQFVQHCKENNQVAGVYIAPFIMWGDDEWQKSTYVPGTNNTVTYYDLRLKKHDGTLYGTEIDGCFPMDVTHPAARLHAQSIVDRFKAAGFQYIKLDYLVHLSFEGDYYDKSIRTGIEAYNYSMKMFTDMLGEDMFVNLAMAPTFPYQYANGRRFGCDAGYRISDTEYTLNGVTYGFWEQKLYDYTDPDHLVAWGKDGKASEDEAIARITSGVVSGTSFLAGDNFPYPAGDGSEAHARYKLAYGNKDVIEAAKLGEVFNPVIDSDCPETANIFILEKNGATYVAVFNYSSISKKYTAQLKGSAYSGRELWSGESVSCENALTCTVPAKSAKLFKLSEVK